MLAPRGASLEKWEERFVLRMEAWEEVYKHSSRAGKWVLMLD